MKTIYAMLFCAALTANVFAADDPSIKGEVRAQLNEAMLAHVEATTVDGDYLIYDVATGNLKNLEFKALHKGVVKKGLFYVSCADFVDAEGRKYDLDFLVAGKGEKLRVLQALVHSVDGEKRPYHLESNK